MAKRDLHQEVTDKILAALEAGTKPWQRNWIATGLPLRANGEEYRGINTLVLGLTAEAAGYASPYWMTFKQAKELGGAVRKGEKSTPIVFYKQFKVDAGDDDAQADENGQKTARVLRGYNVFNVDQIEGLPADRFPAGRGAEPVNPDARDQRAETALRSCGATIHEGGNLPCYIHAADAVHMPAFEAFNGAGSYLATLAHELTHWTGAPHRLDRVKGKKFGDTAYAFEELVAEIGAAFICARLGIEGEHLDNHAAYIQSWLKALRNDKRLIFKAAAQAQLAADMVLANAAAEDAQPATKAEPAPATAPAHDPETVMRARIDEIAARCESGRVRFPHNTDAMRREGTRRAQSAPAPVSDTRQTAFGF